MSLFTTNILYPANLSIPNGYANQMTDKPKNKIIFLDITPPRTAHMKSPSVNSIHPLRDNLIEPQINRDIIYENIKPVFFLLRVLGVLPLSRPSPGVNQFQIASPSMIYSVGCYICLVLYVLYLSLHKVQILRTAEGKFEEAVIEYLFTVYLFPMLLVPIMWYETRKIAGILNGWVEFEICYKKLSGRVLPVKLYKKALAIAVIIPVLSSSSVIITHVTMVDFKAMQIIPYIFLEILTYILGGYWYLLCETLSLCATVLAEDFQMALRNIGPAGKVAEYRALWLRLSKLARGTGIANCYTFTFVNLYLFLIITLSIYGLLSQISEGFGVKDIGLAVTACCSIFLLFFICDEAHYASQNVHGIITSHQLRSQQGRIHHWEHPSEPRNPNSLIGKVAEYRTMWLCLSKLARGTGIANCYTFTFVNLYLFLIITLSIYGLLSQISEGFGVKDIGLAVTACCSIFLLFFICDEAHYASQNVRTNFQKKLLMVELSWMNTDAQTEVNMFLRATEMNPSQISLGGFFDVNRNLFKSLLATMVTYLVVLLQFQISIPDDKRPDEMESEEKLFNITSFAPSETTASTTSLATTILTTLARKKKKN